MPERQAPQGLDRISLSLGRTISEDFNSVRIDVGLSSNVQERESLVEAFQRVEKFCNSRLDDLARKMKRKLLEDLGT